LAKREAELLTAMQTDKIVKSARKDLTQLKNVDRPLYDLLLTKGSGGFLGNNQSNRTAADAYD